MVDFDYLAKGLYAMARAHQVNAMSGHLGAAVVAGYFIGEQHPDLDEKACEGIEADLDRIIRGQSVFSPRKQASITVTEMFKPFPRQSPREDLIDGIAEALEGNIDQTRQSGHNVIFTAIAIRALKDHPDFATPAITDGIRKLIALFNNVTPGSGYYGKGKGRIDGRKVPLPADDNSPPYTNLQEMANTVADALIEHASEHRQGYGGLWHIINHAAALVELARYGYRDLAIKGLPAHHQHLRLWKTLPDLTDELGPRRPTENDPHTTAFWQSEKRRYDSALLTHRPKTLYGFDTLIELIEDETKRERANHSLRFLM